MEYKVERDQCVYQMAPDHEPVLRVPEGAIVTFSTYDCFEDQIKGVEQSIENLNWDQINPATGPVFVEGAEPGDLLRVDILQIQVADYGVMAAIPGAGLLGEDVAESEVKIVPIEDGQAVFNEKIRLPLRPMIGVIGVAPKADTIPCGTPGAHGGNMDNGRIGEGTTLYLPVFQPGALLSLGDLHACMGDGEIMVTGVEIAGQVKVRVSLIKEQHRENPMLEDQQYLYTIASHADLLTAVKMATRDMHKVVMETLGLSFNEAGMLLSAAGNVEICQVVDPLHTVRFSFLKKYLK